MPEFSLPGMKGEILEALPAVCMICGHGADRERLTTFSYTTPMVAGVVFHIRFLSTLLFPCFTKKMNVPIPVCCKHANPWLWSQVFGWLALVVFLFGWGGLSVVLKYFPQNWDLQDIYVVSWPALSLGLAILASILDRLSLRVMEIEKFRIRLTNVHADFIEAFERTQAIGPFILSALEMNDDSGKEGIERPPQGHKRYEGGESADFIRNRARNES